MGKKNTVTLSSPQLRVVLGNPADPDTWAEVEVQTMTRDLAAAETLFGQRKWGKVADHSIKFLAAAAYYALRRTGQVDGSWDDFDASWIEVTEVEATESDPTQPALEAG